MTLQPPLARIGRLLAAQWEDRDLVAPDWQLERAVAFMRATYVLVECPKVSGLLASVRRRDLLNELVAAYDRLDDPDGCQCDLPCCNRRSEGGFLPCEAGCPDRLAADCEDALHQFLAWAADLTGLTEELLREHLTVESTPGPSWPVTVGNRVLGFAS